MPNNEEKRFSKQIIGKNVVSSTGKYFGKVGDIFFETKSGELINLILADPTPATKQLDLEKDKQNNVLIPFSAVVAMGDFVVISEEELS